MKHDIRFTLRMDTAGYEIIKERAKSQRISTAEYTRRLILLGLSLDAGMTPGETDKQLKRLRRSQTGRRDTTVTGSERVKRVLKQKKLGY